ncbi:MULTISPECIES: hypothetical protein [Clostridium]|uniref:hypothetical protein n=1 Tax=Clostridium TaxID=1485 RepID=UPI0028FF9529|nr:MULTISPECIES: hypothetical protein [Clostridium]MDU1005559.1 hypothetical protein [Clostridium butyricum]MDU6540331.1 hypothetical protein [Clostridium sp.]
MDRYDEIEKNKLRVTHMGNEKDDKLYQALCQYDEHNVYEIGNVLMTYITQQYHVKDGVDIIKRILNDFASDFSIHDLPDGEVERLRNILKQI